MNTWSDNCAKLCSKYLIKTYGRFIQLLDRFQTQIGRLRLDPGYPIGLTAEQHNLNRRILDLDDLITDTFSAFTSTCKVFTFHVFPRLKFVVQQLQQVEIMYKLVWFVILFDVILKFLEGSVEELERKKL